METLKKEIRSLKAQLKYKEGARRAGFAMFYAEEERNFNMMFSHENKMRTILKNAVGENSIPKHIENELKELYEETKKVIECPICLDIINREG